MIFTVTYRAKDGAKAETEVEAESRAACFARCKARGIAPLGVREGRAARADGQGRRTGGRDARDGRRAVFLGVVGVLGILALGVWWRLAARPAAEPAEPVVAEKPKAAKPRPAPGLEAKPAATNAAGAAQPSEPAAATGEKAFGEAATRKLTMAERGIRVAKPRKPLRPKRFKYDAEEHIAFFMETEPGSVVFGEIPYGPKFVEDFKASLKEPVATSPDDSEDVLRLKRAVQETKEELKARMEAGEDVAKIMRDARKQLIELGGYKSALEEDLKKIARNGEFNEEEFGKFVNAANKMLEAKGLPPIKPTRMMYKMLELKARRSNAK